MAADTMAARFHDSHRAASDSKDSQAPSVAEVYEAHFDYVWRCLRSLGVQDGSLDDAAHDVFLVVHQKLADFDGACQLRTWLYAIVINVARRYRAQANTSAREPAVEEADTRCTQRSVESMQQLELARQALEGLDDDKREVFVLSEIEDMSAPEIAVITAVPVNTVYSRLRAARLEFSARIERLTRDRKRGTR